MSDDYCRCQAPRSREDILKFAGIARSEIDEGERRFIVKGLCRDRYRAGPDYDGPPTNISDEQIIREAYGPDEVAVYWRAWMFGATDRTELVQAIAAHSATSQAEWYRIWRKLLDALVRAPADQDFFADARWLSENPITRRFIPATLAAVVAPQTASPPSPMPTTDLFSDEKRPAQARKRGPKSLKVPAVATAMRDAVSRRTLTCETLEHATEESLVAEFGTSRDTVRKARMIVLSEFVGDRVPGK